MSDAPAGTTFGSGSRAGEQRRGAARLPADQATGPASGQAPGIDADGSLPLAGAGAAAPGRGPSAAAATGQIAVPSAAQAGSDPEGAAVSPAAEPARKLRLATVWLAGCSGCHMSFLDLDEWLFDLAERVEIVFSPVASDVKAYPEQVDICLVEGAVANADNLELALQLRARTAVVVSFGDCAVTANVPGLRNLITPGGRGSAMEALKRSYLELADAQPQLPLAPGVVPELLAKVLPLHEVIPVDVFLPGCPPPAARIRACLEPLLRGERPRLEGPELLRFG